MTEREFANKVFNWANNFSCDVETRDLLRQAGRELARLYGLEIEMTDSDYLESKRSAEDYAAGYAAGWQAAREMAAKIASKHWAMNDDCGRGKLTRSPGWDSACIMIERAIRAIQPPERK